MTCPVKFLRAALGASILVAGLSLSAAPAALGQVGARENVAPAPIRITRPEQGRSAADAVQATDIGDTEDEPVISVSTLDAVDPLAVSALSRRQGGFPPDLWNGSDLASALGAIDAAPIAGSSPVAAQLVARALASGGAPPAGGEGVLELARARLAALAGLGRAEEAAILVLEAEVLRSDPIAARIGAEAALATGQEGPACELEQAMSARQEARQAAMARDGEAGEPEAEEGKASDDALNAALDDPFWPRLRAACFSLAGEAAAAEITFDLAKERGVDGADDAFFAFLVRATGGVTRREATSPRDGIELALARAGDVAVELDDLERLDPLQWASVARDEGASVAARLKAARTLVGIGAIDAETVAQIYAAAVGAPNLPAAEILLAAQDAQGAERDALLNQAVRAADAPAQKAEAVAAALALADDAQAFALASALYAGEIAFLPVSRETTVHAPAFVEATAARGDAGLGRAWLRARLRVGVPGLGAAPQEPLDLQEGAWLLALIEAADVNARPADLTVAAEAWLEATGAAPQPEKDAAGRGAALLVALGAQNTTTLRRAAALATSAGPDASADLRALVRSLWGAAEAGAMAETALYAAAILEATPIQDSAARAEAVRALRAVGLEEDARRAVVETLIGDRRGA